MQSIGRAIFLGWKEFDYTNKKTGERETFRALYTIDAANGTTSGLEPEMMNFERGQELQFKDFPQFAHVEVQYDQRGARRTLRGIKQVAK
jgi:hypothetical protein